MAARWRARGTVVLFSGSSSSSSSSSLVTISSWLAREKLPGRAVFVKGFNDDRGMEASASPPLAFLRGTAAPAARSLIVVEVGRFGDGCGSGGTAAPAACDLVNVDACVVGLLFEGLGLTSALDGRGRFRAAVGRLSAPRLLAGDGGACRS